MLKKLGYIVLAALLILTTAAFGMSGYLCNNNIQVSFSNDSSAKQCFDGHVNHCCNTEKDTIIIKGDFTKPSVDETKILEHGLFGTALAELINEYPRETTHPSVLSGTTPPPGTHLFLSKIQAYLL